jgi:hypothetical protein
MEPNQRKCPECDIIITYTNKYECNRAEKKKNICRKHYSGERNAFYNKKHSKSTKKFLSKIRKGKDCYGDENKKKLRKKMTSNNPMSGKSIYDVWVEKYGKKEANRKMIELKLKHSKNNSGKNNNMYGKPSPKGSGNGWSGWYNGWFFRSIRELSYMINVIEKKDLKWENGEQKKYKISYLDWEGKQRNYFPDFIVENKYMIECKPKRLQLSAGVLSKKKGAKNFCKKNNLKYILIEPKMLSLDKVKELYVNKKIKFIQRYEEKFLKKYF